MVWKQLNPIQLTRIKDTHNRAVECKFALILSLALLASGCQPVQLVQVIVTEQAIHTATSQTSPPQFIVPVTSEPTQPEPLPTSVFISEADSSLMSARPMNTYVTPAPDPHFNLSTPMQVAYLRYRFIHSWAPTHDHFFFPVRLKRTT
jgi:hypothetical protein